jgi:hypothetical protein
VGTVLTEVSGFTPLIDDIISELGLVTAAVFGTVWRYCQMESGTCTASLETIASRLNINRKTVERHIKMLCEMGYLEDTTPGRRHSPHVYRDTSKAKLVGSLNGRTESLTTTIEVGQRVLAGKTESPTRPDRESHPGKTESPIKIHSKIPLEDRSKDTSSPPTAEIAPPPAPKKPPSKKLEPETWQGRMMFAKLQANARAKGRRVPKQFGSLEQKTKFIEAVARLDGRFETALDAGLGNGILAVGKLVNYIASPKWQEEKQPRRKERQQKIEEPLDVRIQREEVRRRLGGGD